MNKEELMAALAFYTKVEAMIGAEDFRFYKDMIYDNTSGILDVWKSQGRKAVDLYENEGMLLMTVLVCAAQELLDGILEKNTKEEK